jgi:hypothetical protein
MPLPLFFSDLFHFLQSPATFFVPREVIVQSGDHGRNSDW